MKRTPRLLAHFAAALFCASPALGCAPLADPPSWDEWIWASSPLFLGTVIEIKPLTRCATLPQDRPANVCVVLRVDDDIRGGLAEEHEVEQYTTLESTCDRSVPFAVGERWLLAGDYSGYPSELLSGAAEAILPHESPKYGRLSRAPSPSTSPGSRSDGIHWGCAN